MPESVADTRKLYVYVTNDDGETVYRTWNADHDWKTVTLYLGETERPLTDERAEVMGETIGKSIWGIDPLELRRELHETREREAERRDFILIECSKQLAEQMTDWGPPVECRIVERDGRHEMEVRTVPSEVAA